MIWGLVKVSNPTPTEESLWSLALSKTIQLHKCTICVFFIETWKTAKYVCVEIVQMVCCCVLVAFCTTKCFHLHLCNVLLHSKVFYSSLYWCSYSVFIENAPPASSLTKTTSSLLACDIIISRVASVNKISLISRCVWNGYVYHENIIPPLSPFLPFQVCTAVTGLRLPTARWLADESFAPWAQSMRSWRVWSRSAAPSRSLRNPCGNAFLAARTRLPHLKRRPRILPRWTVPSCIAAPRPTPHSAGAS